MTEYATAAGTTNNGSMTFEAIDDGQKPGNTTASTQLVTNLNKASTKFLLVFDGLVSSEWCSRAYKYALEKQRPWGVYVTKAEAINRTEFDTESLYHAGEVERSIAIEYARALIYEKGVMDLFLYSYFPSLFLPSDHLHLLICYFIALLIASVSKFTNMSHFSLRFRLRICTSYLFLPHAL